METQQNEAGGQVCPMTGGALQNQARKSQEDPAKHKGERGGGPRPVPRGTKAGGGAAQEGVGRAASPVQQGKDGVLWTRGNVGAVGGGVSELGSPC